MMGKGTRIARFVRKVAALGLAGCMLLGLSSEAFAATLKDVFDEHYYADRYVDLKDAFGYDREQLWNHFMMFGINEGRTMNELIDIVKYRAMYEDLDAAFGNDWDAYLEHYLTYGAKEGRDTGMGFNALDYAERYEDLKEAFGHDVLALWNHYEEYGARENREARSQAVVAAEKEAQTRALQAAQEPPSTVTPGTIPPSTPSQPDASVPTNRTEKVDCEDDRGGWDINEYDEDGKRIRETCYGADGTIYFIYDYEYDSAGNVIKNTCSNADGTDWC